jgi:hypothetical protein
MTIQIENVINETSYDDVRESILSAVRASVSDKAKAYRFDGEDLIEIELPEIDILRQKDHK